MAFSAMAQLPYEPVIVIAGPACHQTEQRRDKIPHIVQSTVSISAGDMHKRGLYRDGMALGCDSSAVSRHSRRDGGASGRL